MTNNHYCGACGSRDIRFTLGPCAGCGLSLDGERDPKSRAEGMFHAACWARRVTSGVRSFVEGDDDLRRKFGG